MIDKDEYFKTLQEMIDNIDASVKAVPEVYEARLSACKECERLADGMCRACGCYVELRAAIGTNSCPYSKW